MSLLSDVAEYCRELRQVSAECARPESDGEKCVQCRERLKIADHLEEILFRNTAWSEQLLKYLREPLEQLPESTQESAQVGL